MHLRRPTGPFVSLKIRPDDDQGHLKILSLKQDGKEGWGEAERKGEEKREGEGGEGKEEEGERKRG